ncbi:Oidioi.mRNA.OKI2018_I69.XSR.g14020.t1.cds [Oikopleura dioica]|uniref:Oidioi.mRNA.OKI2018_I69.XSR.g14020.t1.cds n=1 Tax=Oikopleura dioica TaxID=34765 RepID=A0ABN7SCL8_OIKDI|nr:Oidioi.mRNA.OKI2018_I69.XSR.g14020.t1.cds [Oikopleura dioica]
MIEKAKRSSRDQWFHASLDRSGAEKLLNLYPPGSFLVRQTGDNSGHFSLSVVGPDKKAHHFVLEQKYGTICIGSSVYSNLESVIENYMSQPLFPSHDLSLQNPINPPVLHVPKRVRCKFPYNADPETDELTVQFGEILIVHQESEPEWIWAESLLTGKHGAVFADLIEPLDEDSDPLLGHSWFNNERRKDEIVEILKGPKVRAGTFLIRPSDDRIPQQGSSRFYTLFLRGSKSIEKMRIERNASGRIVFGGRTNSRKNSDLLNSTWIKYLAFDTTEECLDWSNLLDKLIVQRKSQIQIRRSVSVALHGGSGLPVKALDCLICLDGIPVGRSLPQNGPDPHWHLAEDYPVISSLPETASFILRKANSSSSEPFATVHHCCGEEEPSDGEAITTTSLPVATYQAGEEIVGAELRFTVRLDFRVLLPDEEFERLFDLLVSGMDH